MKISCPACAAKYSIADEKVQDRLAKIRCRKCGTTIVIDGKVSPASVYAADGGGHADAGHEGHEGHETMADDGGAPAGGAGGAAGEFTVDFGENDQRSMSLSDLVAAYNAGQVTGETYVWADGFADWTALADVPQVVEALNAAARAPARPTPAPAPAFSAPTFQQQPASAPRVAAVASTARRGGDLFGGIDTAGSEEDVATSAPQEPAHPAPATAATGARNESSVLFSLSALTSAAKSSKPTQSAPAAIASPMIASASASTDDDDSGLIDLKALSSAAAAADKPAGDLLAAPLMPSPLGAPPLGMAAPLAIDSSIDTSMPQSKSKTGIIAAMILAIAAIVIAGMFLLRPATPPPEPQATPAAPLPTRTAAPEPVATQDTTAKPPATGTAAEDAGAKTASSKKAGGGYRRKSGGGSSTAPATDKGSSGGSSAPAAAPPKKKGGCGCTPGDLQCAMACAAKGG